MSGRFGCAAWAPAHAGGRGVKSFPMTRLRTNRKQVGTDEPDRFTIDPTSKMPGLNS